MSIPNSVTLRVLGERAWAHVGFSEAMREKRPVTDRFAGYTFHAYGDWFQIVRDPVALPKEEKDGK